MYSCCISAWSSFELISEGPKSLMSDKWWKPHEQQTVFSAFELPWNKVDYSWDLKVTGCVWTPLFSDSTLSACPGTWARTKVDKKRQKQRNAESCFRALLCENSSWMTYVNALFVDQEVMAMPLPSPYTHLSSHFCLCGDFHRYNTLPSTMS